MAYSLSCVHKQNLTLKAKQEETIASPPLSDTVVAVAVDEAHKW